MGGEGATEDETVGGITDSMDISLGELRELVMDREVACCSPQRVKHDLATVLN